MKLRSRAQQISSQGRVIRKAMGCIEL